MMNRRSKAVRKIDFRRNNARTASIPRPFERGRWARSLSLTTAVITVADIYQRPARIVTCITSGGNCYVKLRLRFFFFFEDNRNHSHSGPFIHFLLSRNLAANLTRRTCVLLAGGREVTALRSLDPRLIFFDTFSTFSPTFLHKILNKPFASCSFWRLIIAENSLMKISYIFTSKPRRVVND